LIKKLLSNTNLEIIRIIKYVLNTNQTGLPRHLKMARNDGLDYNVVLYLYAEVIKKPIDYYQSVFFILIFYIKLSTY
jgi:hypothetical protein